MKKVLIVIFCVLLLSSCTKSTLIGDKLTDKATEQQQEQVKQEVLKLLEQEYNQPFKIVDYNYDYSVHWKDKTCAIASMCPKVFYGVYSFKIQSINNPIIIMQIRMEDTKEGLQWFKSNQLNNYYCSSLTQIFRSKNQNYINQDDLEKAKRYCDSRGQSYYKKWEK
ncbi:hypothetical protein IBE48_04920 [Francisella philomiragia]|uniref:Lipoprotein n=1 Tax=Francisella philomiragia TaxID=28110 RepID=A0AAW3DAA2_9GAMM|nr:hypothetical protein [Francisella philomiragia]KFJ42300.1 putative lipoprotein [Francisella philomiragia]MBK2254013.1 hypothetical protein [Francisella philomiragia]MBK2272325.1 hypothetical protein [Francisella philomiragia]MBK2276167.1 hypothetical protein [Francisella philomiragia]MBK2280114.1 hypothetical protein [Francisella philomiragia]